MSRQGGRGNNRVAKTTRSTRSTAQVVMGTKCMMCEVEVGEDGIGCDNCQNWYHPTPVCVSLPRDVIKTIKDYGGQGIEFVCTSCRVARSNAVDGANAVGGLNATKFSSVQSNGDVGAVQQLFETVKSLCVVVTKLGNDMKEFFDKSVSTQNQSCSSPSSEDLKLTIREEIREMDERDKNEVFCNSEGA